MTDNTKTEDQHYYKGNSDEISIKEILLMLFEWFKYLKSHWLKFLVIGFLSGTFGFFYAWRQPIKYTAKLTFVVEDGKSTSSGFGGLASLAGQFGVDIGGVSGGGLLSGDNILLYFKSTALAREVLLSEFNGDSSKSIADVYAEVYNLSSNWKTNLEVGEVKFQPLTKNTKYTRVQDSLLQRMIDDIIKTQFSVNRTDKKAGFIDVTTTMLDESLAKVYCETVVNEAVNQYITIKTQRQKNTVDKLQNRVDSISRLLEKKTLSSATLQASTSTMDINPLYRAGSLVSTETTVRDKTLLATIFASVTQNLELAKFTLSQETPVIQIVDSPFLPLKKEKLSRLKAAIIFSVFGGFFVLCFLIVKRVLKKHFTISS